MDYEAIVTTLETKRVDKQERYVAKAETPGAPKSQKARTLTLRGGRGTLPNVTEHNDAERRSKWDGQDPAQ